MADSVKLSRRRLNRSVIWAFGLGFAMLSFIVISVGRNPQSADMSEFSADIRSGQVKEVQYSPGDFRFTVRWSVEFASYKETDYIFSTRAGAQDDVPRLREEVGDTLPPGDKVEFTHYNSRRHSAILDALILPVSVLYMPWDYLIPGVILVGLALLIMMMLRESTVFRSRLVWPLLSVVTGFGFILYLLLERGRFRVLLAKLGNWSRYVVILTAIGSEALFLALGF